MNQGLEFLSKAISIYPDSARCSTQIYTSVEMRSRSTASRNIFKGFSDLVGHFLSLSPLVFLHE